MLLYFRELLQFRVLSGPRRGPAFAHLIRSCIVALSALICTSACEALPQPASALPEGRMVAEVPAGFVSFCLRFADQCDNGKPTDAVIKLAPGEWKSIEEVNARENRAIKPMDDQRHYGRAEYWTIPADGYGDCEDYALAKRQLLIQRGLPPGTLRLAVVRTGDGLGHAVLTVATDRGDFVLDNLTDAALPWNQTPYVWISRQSSTDPWRWVSFQHSAPVLTAVVPSTPRGSDASHP